MKSDTVEQRVFDKVKLYISSIFVHRIKCSIQMSFCKSNKYINLKSFKFKKARVQMINSSRSELVNSDTTELIFCTRSKPLQFKYLIFSLYFTVKIPVLAKK